MALEQFKVQCDVRAISEHTGNGLVGYDGRIFVSSVDPDFRSVYVTRSITAFVLAFFSLKGCLSEIVVAVLVITVVDRHHFFAGNFDYCLFL